MSARIRRPADDEYAPYYAGYVHGVPDGDILVVLAEQLERTASLVAPLSEAEAGYRYRPEKWSIRQIIGHVSDTERVMAYRALCIARGERLALPGFDQDDYVAGGQFDARTLPSLIGELRAVRAATLALFDSLDGPQLARRGTANGVEVTVRALAYIIAGHERHHQTVLAERYLGSARQSGAGSP